jgi:hypothetical protein
MTNPENKISFVKGATLSLGLLGTLLLAILSSNMIKLGNVDHAFAEQKTQILATVQLDLDIASNDRRRIEVDSAKRADTIQILSSIDSLREEQKAMTATVHAALSGMGINLEKIKNLEKSLDDHKKTDDRRIGSVEEDINKLEAKMQ